MSAWLAWSPATTSRDATAPAWPSADSRRAAGTADRDQRHRKVPRDVSGDSALAARPGGTGGRSAHDEPDPVEGKRRHPQWTSRARRRTHQAPARLPQFLPRRLLARRRDKASLELLKAGCSSSNCEDPPHWHPTRSPARKSKGWTGRRTLTSMRCRPCRISNPDLNAGPPGRPGPFPEPQLRAPRHSIRSSRDPRAGTSSAGKEATVPARPFNRPRARRSGVRCVHGCFRTVECATGTVDGVLPLDG